MPRRVNMIELQDIIHRLRLGQSVKAIHRETGRHKTVVRTLKARKRQNNRTLSKERRSAFSMTVGRRGRRDSGSSATGRFENK